MAKDGEQVLVVALDGIPIGPTWHKEYFLGADSSGRDVAVRLLYGGRNSLLIGVVAALGTIFIGVVLGVLAGYLRGWTDGVISRVLDVIWSFPVILLGIALGTALALGGLKLGPVTIAGDSLAIPILIIAVVYIPYLARPIRGQVLSLREKEFVEAARAQGMGPFRIMFSEILPNIVTTLIVFFPLLIANAILLEAALSFLGAGVRPPEPSWGTMIQDGVDRIVTAPMLAVDPRRDAGADRALAERLRRRRPRRARSAREGEDRALMVEALREMARFVVRRLFSMLVVLFAVSVLTFLIFNVIPNGDPAVRMAGKQPTESQIEAIREEWGFDENIVTQYATTMKKLFTGDMVSYFTQLNVVEEIWKGIPANALAGDRGGDDLDGVRRGPRPVHRDARRASVSDTLLTVLALIGISMPVFWIGALMNHYLGFKAGHLPQRRLRRVHREPDRLGSTT